MAYTYTTPWLLVVAELLILVSITESKVPAIIVFGDSTVDAGNNNVVPTFSRAISGLMDVILLVVAPQDGSLMVAFLQTSFLRLLGSNQQYPLT